LYVHKLIELFSLILIDKGRNLRFQFSIIQEFAVIFINSRIDISERGGTIDEPWGYLNRIAMVIRKIKLTNTTAIRAISTGVKIDVT